MQVETIGQWGTAMLLLLAASALVAIAVLAWRQSLNRRVRPLQQALDAATREAAAHYAAQAMLETARKDAVTAREEFLAMSETLPMAIYQMENGPSGYRRFTFVSKRTEAVLGVSAEDILANPENRWRYAHPEDLLRVQAYMRDTVELARLAGRALPFETELRILRNGQERWVRIASLPIRTRPDGVSFWSGYYEDISERKENMATLKLSKEQAEQAAQAKADFLANMSHEIRTPLNAVIGMTHLMRNTTLTAQQHHYQQKIHDSSRHLLGVINDVLDFSKIESGKLVVEYAEFDLSHLLERVTGMVLDKARQKRIELVVEVAPDVPQRIEGDELRLGQILVNYANNAVKFTERGEVTLAVTVQALEGDEVLLRFTVTDSGIGLTPEQIGGLFQSFAQADASTTRKYGGTGLGLAISKRLAELMGGEAGVDSRLGEGSRFWFTVRARVGATTPTQALALQNQGAWVVDNHPGARRLLAGLLARLGLAVQTFASGNQALVHLQQAAPGSLPALVLIDDAMPEWDGPHTLRVLQERWPAPAPHWVMASAYPREELLEQIHGPQLPHVLAKPVFLSSLRGLLATVLGGQAPDAAASATGTDPGSPLAHAGLAGARVLLVEDNDINQEVATALLREVGCLVDVAENGQIAIERVQQQAYDLVLMDMQMPVMDGLTATMQIRRIPHLQALPIIAMTANVMRHDRERCQAAGMNDFVGKPIDPGELWRTLQKWRRSGAHRPTLPKTPSMESGATQAGHGPWPANIAGLDMVLGRSRVLGNETLYRSMLYRFVAGQADSPQAIAQAMAGRQFALAERLAHTAKGVAGNIGAVRLQAAAYALEQTVREPTDDTAWRPVWLAYREALQALLAGLTPALADARRTSTTPVAATQVDPVPVLARLRQLLHDDDPEASGWWSAHAQVLRRALGDEVFDQVERTIESFDLDVALQLLSVSDAVGGEPLSR